MQDAKHSTVYFEGFDHPDDNKDKRTLMNKGCMHGKIICASRKSSKHLCLFVIGFIAKHSNILECRQGFCLQWVGEVDVLLM